MNNTTLYVTREYKISYLNGSIVLDNGKKQSFNLENVQNVVFEDDRTSVSLYTLNVLASKNIGVLFCNGKKLPNAMLVPVYSAGTADSVIKQTAWDTERFPHAWKRIVGQKISCQKQVLAKYGKNVDFDEQITEGDVTNVEGRFAKEYFKALFGKNFRRHISDEKNALLDYGYALLLSKTCQIIYSHGYITQYGLHHKGKNNRFNLAYDILEPFRPLVDRLAFLTEGELDTQNKKFLISVLNEEITYKGRKYALPYAMDLFFTDVVDFLETGKCDIGDVILFD